MPMRPPIGVRGAQISRQIQDKFEPDLELGAPKIPVCVCFTKTAARPERRNPMGLNSFNSSEIRSDRAVTDSGSRTGETCENVKSGVAVLLRSQVASSVARYYRHQCVRRCHLPIVCFRPNKSAAGEASLRPVI